MAYGFLTEAKCAALHVKFDRQGGVFASSLFRFFASSLQHRYNFVILSTVRRIRWETAYIATTQQPKPDIITIYTGFRLQVS